MSGGARKAVGAAAGTRRTGRRETAETGIDGSLISNPKFFATNHRGRSSAVRHPLQFVLTGYNLNARSFFCSPRRSRMRCRYEIAGPRKNGVATNNEEVSFLFIASDNGRGKDFVRYQAVVPQAKTHETGQQNPSGLPTDSLSIIRNHCVGFLSSAHHPIRISSPPTIEDGEKSNTACRSA